MSKLIYSFLASLDGYVADDAGGFEWAVPDEEVLEFINGLEHREHLHEIEGLGGCGHDRAPLLVELGGLLGDQRGAHPRRRSVGERRAARPSRGSRGGCAHADTITIPHPLPRGSLPRGHCRLSCWARCGRATPAVGSALARSGDRQYR